MSSKKESDTNPDSPGKHSINNDNQQDNNPNSKAFEEPLVVKYSPKNKSKINQVATAQGIIVLDEDNPSQTTHPMEQNSNFNSPPRPVFNYKVPKNLENVSKSQALDINNVTKGIDDDINTYESVVTSLDTNVGKTELQIHKTVP